MSKLPPDDVVTGHMTVQPAGHVIEVRTGESLMQAAWREEYHWPTLCFGVGQCTACQFEVVEGLDQVSPHTEQEREMLRDLAGRRRRINPQRIRLACQVKIRGDVVVKKPGVRKAERDK
ncbi:2Fe-2S iron-sulfur cluster-binding protein [Rhodococcus sp. OK302]|uniref:2Fe-2S iron-sulfur cluster-binding protein n=1 Tax=Rhodococcus sp. OK302 TaxID=1882769 RepID=UPI000B9F4EF0|nr:2Fe-2S iron-sulfur cluster-binding protein [Rhodococcus sp. OK302]OYD70412.1 2Fe-2S ferredoxin [Rhodococcus sp. OK302]